MCVCVWLCVGGEEEEVQHGVELTKATSSMAFSSAPVSPASTCRRGKIVRQASVRAEKRGENGGMGGGEREKGETSLC